MRERRKLLPSSLFIEAIEGAKNELEEQQSFIEDGIKDPEILFRDSYQKLGKRALTLHIMNGFLFDESKLQVHDFQVFLAEQINLFVQAWAKSKGIVESVSIEVRKPNTYPSIFAVYHEDIELIQFSVLEKFYGIRSKAKDPNTIIIEYRERENQVERNIKPLLDRVREYQDLIDAPHKYIWKHYRRQWKTSLKNKRIKNMFRLPFLEIGDHFTALFRIENIVEKFQLKIDSTMQSIERERENLNRYPNIQHYIIENQLQQELTEKLIPLFEQYEYRLETEQYKLY